MDHVEICRAIWRQKATVENLKERLAGEVTQLNKLMADAIKLLDAQGLAKQHLPGYGTVSLVTKASIQVPKSPDTWRVVFDYIRQEKGQDTLDGMLCIHSATLNAFYNAEREARASAGDYKWAMPGIGEPKEYTTLGMTKERAR